jgi:hypothetical protein
MSRRPVLLPFVILLGGGPAWALQPSEHRALAEAACSDVGLPPAFCHRMGKEAFETDWHEWSDLSAHAQRELDQPRCTAADAATARVYRLAREAVTKTRAGDAEGGAIALGRAVHTLQDECAHHGMTNQEHAFYSLTQACTDADVSPDVQPEAIACAQTRTRDAFAVVATALAGTQWTQLGWLCTDSEDRDTCQAASLPAPWTACSFLREHDDWDGEDSRWDGGRVGPALVAAFGAGLEAQAAPRPMCGGDPAAIDPPHPRATVTDLAAGCGVIDIACLGKVDEDTATAETESTGCSTGRGTGAPLVLVLALLLTRATTRGRRTAR